MKNRNFFEKVAFKLVRLPIPWLVRRSVSVVLAIIFFKYSKIEHSLSGTLLKNGQCIFDAKEFFSDSESRLNWIFTQAKKSKLTDQWGVCDRLYHLNDVPETVNTSKVIMSDCLNKKVTEIGHEIKSHPLIVSYFKAVPNLDNYQIWFSHAAREPREAQLWHRDLDNILALKVFIYLTNVDDYGGPHFYLRGTHRWNKHLMFARLTDNEIPKGFGFPKNSKINGPAGTLIVEDTFGLHKGSVPTGIHDRCILQYQFALFRNP